MKNTVSLLCLLMLFPYASEVLAESGLCKADEINFTSCSVGEKVASFCASKNLTAKSGYFQYRFGTTQKVELTYPEARQPPTGIFFTSMSPDGLENRISFKNGLYTYIFFGVDSPAGASYGIHILKSGVLKKTLTCSDQFSDQIPIGFDLMTTTEFVRIRK